MKRKLQMTDMTRKLEMTDMTKKLPAEMLMMIFRLLPPSDLSSVVLVCRRWRQFGETPMLWSEVSLTVSWRNLHSLSEMLSCWRLQRVRKLIVKIPVTKEEELQSVKRHQGLSKLVMMETDSLEPGLLVKSVNKLETLKCPALTTGRAESILRAISQISHLKTLDSGHVKLRPVLRGA